MGISDDFFVSNVCEHLFSRGAEDFGHILQADKYKVYRLNIWRNINSEEAIQNYSLAVLDRLSIQSQDAVPHRVDLGDSILEQCTIRYSPSHRWVYFPQMRSDEILMFRQGQALMERNEGGLWKMSGVYDGHPQTVFHTGVEDPGGPTSVQRDS